jgi:prepilin signal peptidase PulO-like enzyme (type II secretory pathway)
MASLQTALQKYLLTYPLYEISTFVQIAYLVILQVNTLDLVVALRGYDHLDRRLIILLQHTLACRRRFSSS